MFRNYQDNAISDFYKKLRSRQCVAHVKEMHSKYLKFDKKISIADALDAINKFVDESDPDLVGLPNIHHFFQTAEAIRHDGLDEWLQVTGFIHDLGKLLYLRGCDEDGTSIKEQWSIVGDTFIVGCKIPDTVVYPQFNCLNPDYNNPLYNTELGMYEEHIGLDNCMCSFGHDEYLYQLLKANECTLPEEAYYIIRYHSLYPWHSAGVGVENTSAGVGSQGTNVYTHLMNDKDHKMLEWVKFFNKYDLYTKVEKEVNINGLMDYYINLIRKFLPNEIFY